MVCSWHQKAHPIQSTAPLPGTNQSDHQLVSFTLDNKTGIKTDSSLRGAIPRSFEHIYKHIARTTDQQYLVRASYLEIYQEKIRDLLSKDQNKRLELRERPDTGSQYFLNKFLTYIYLKII